MDVQPLQDAGLTKNESKVYLALLDLGSSKAGLLTRKTGIHRRNVYDAIEMLIEKGLVSYIQENNVKVYAAVDPRRLAEIIKEREQNIDSILPELESKFNFIKTRKETVFFRGKQGVKTIFDNQIKEGKEVLVLGACPFAKDIIKYYFLKYDSGRVRKRMKIKAIFTKKIDYKIPLSEIRYLPEVFDSPTATNIYGNKVAIILWSEEPFAILINQKEVADSYRSYFELLWKQAKR